MLVVYLFRINGNRGCGLHARILLHLNMRMLWSTFHYAVVRLYYVVIIVSIFPFKTDSCQVL